MAGDRSFQDKVGMHEDWKDGHDQNRLHVNSILEDYLERIIKLEKNVSLIIYELRHLNIDLDENIRLRKDKNG